MNIGQTIFLIAAVIIFLYDAWKTRSLIALGLACFSASFVLTIALSAK